MIARTILSILMFTILAAIASGQTDSLQNETESKVAELEKFHEVMFPIWHLEYPEQDYKALRGHGGEVSKLAGQIYSASLPGILRDKKTKWENGVAGFKNAVDEYLMRSAGNDDDLLLKSVENLHSKYENLVRIIRPVLKEVDTFHKDLYLIYHTHLPANDYKKIQEMSRDLVRKAEAITRAKLPSRLSAKEDEFKRASTSLLVAAKNLEMKGSAGQYKETAVLVEQVHSSYQKLEEIF